jgi:hypothetical protein
MSCVEGSPGYWTVDLDRVVAEALESDVLGCDERMPERAMGGCSGILLCGFFFPTHLCGEGRVIGKPPFSNGLVERFGCRGSKSGGSIENEFSVLFVTDDVGGC